MNNYWKKSIVVEAEQFIDSSPETLLKIYDFTGGVDNGVDIVEETFIIHFPSGNVKGKLGDWIVKGVEGKFYSCLPSIFKSMFKGVEDA